VQPSFLFYDLETFGRDPRRSRIAQFAALRTDLELRPIEPPVSLFCQPADDLLPSPTACLLTGITPQRAEREGVTEAEFASRVHEAMAVPGTCVVGYNSLRFDDEFVRCLFYRNFHDPYEREWKQGNTRWDLLDLARLAYALRPDGIEWPRREDGAPSFRLEDLARANGLVHAQAHEALSDVEATLALAQRIRAAQPRLFDYFLGFRSKSRAAALLDFANRTPVLHVSGRYPARQRCAALVLPIAPHPTIANRMLVCDLAPDPTPLMTLTADEIADRLYTPAADLPEGEVRIGLKEIHLNRCPALIELRHLGETDLDRLCVDLSRCLAHAELLNACGDLADRVRQVYARRGGRDPADADQALYDGLPDDSDRARFADVRRASPDVLAANRIVFREARFNELLFRYRARNWPATLDAAEAERWREYRAGRLAAESGLSEYSFESYYAEIDQLRHARGSEPGVTVLLDALQAWGLRLQEAA
jgi:exodeoxyribonuclease I